MKCKCINCGYIYYDDDIGNLEARTSICPGCNGTGVKWYPQIIAISRLGG